MNTGISIKRLAHLVLMMLMSHSVLAVESNYEDSPMTIDIQVETLLSGYSERALQHLPYFKEQFQQPSGRSFYVVTRIYDGQEYEQVFVGVDKIEADVIYGKIKSQPVGRIDFEFDEAIELADPAVVDWLIVNTDGTEEGNLLGKALDLLQVGHAAVIFELIPEDKRLKDCAVVSVLNAKTKQEVIELVPPEVLEAFTKTMKAEYESEV